MDNSDAVKNTTDIFNAGYKVLKRLAKAYFSIATILLVSGSINTMFNF